MVEQQVLVSERVSLERELAQAALTLALALCGTTIEQARTGRVCRRVAAARRIAAYVCAEHGVGPHALSRALCDSTLESVKVDYLVACRHVQRRTETGVPGWPVSLFAAVCQAWGGVRCLRWPEPEGDGGGWGRRMIAARWKPSAVRWGCG